MSRQGPKEAATKEAWHKGSGQPFLREPTRAERRKQERFNKKHGI